MASGMVIAPNYAARPDVVQNVYPVVPGEIGVTDVRHPVGHFHRYGAIGDGSVGPAAILAALQNVWDTALALTVDMWGPEGTFDVGDNNFPWRQSVVASLLDCGNITLRCAGPATVFKTTSSDGADVFQLNGLKNFHVVGFPTLTATLTALTGSGSNGCSVTNGWDNLTLEITALNLPSVDAGTFVDGGKALSLQPGTATDCGTITARVRAKGCSEGFGYEDNLVASLSRAAVVQVDVVAEDCYIAAKQSAAAATGPLTEGMCSGVVVRGSAINCQQDVVLSRAHGVDVDIRVVTTKTAAARRLDPNGVAWRAANTVVEALLCNYAKNSRVIVTGDKGECDYKARIGGAATGSSGQPGRTEHCDIYLDVGGTAASANVEAEITGGNSMANSRLFVTTSTATTLPAAFYTKAYGNTLSIGPAPRMVNPSVAGRLSICGTAAGNTESGAIDTFGLITGLQGKYSSTVNEVIAGLYDVNGVLRLGIRNGSGIVVDTLGSSVALGAYIGKQAVLDSAGNLIGFFPVYA